MTEPTLQQIIDHLRAKHGCHTFILYGSRARGDFTPSSDYDILCIRSSGASIRDTRLIQGFYLDAFIYPEEQARKVDESLLRVRGGLVLEEKDDQGSALLRAVDDLYRAGPKALAPDELHARQIWARKMLDRISRGGPEDIEGNFRRVWLLNSLLEDYFIYRREWYRGPKEACLWLKANDRITYELYDEALKPGASLDRIRALVDRVLAVAGANLAEPTASLRLERVNIEKAPLIQEILDHAPQYSRNTEGTDPEPDAATNLFTALPPHCTQAQKHVLVIRHDEQAIGVIDLIQGYPDDDCSFIGLFLLREDNQAQGLGRLGYQAVEDYAREYLVAARLRLAVVDSNPAQEFWEKMGFRATGEIKPHHGNRIQSTKRVMEKRLSWRRSLP